MDIFGFIRDFPLKYLVSIIVSTSIMGTVWYWLSTPGPSVSSELILALALLMAIIHIVVYKYRHGSGRRG